MPVWLRRFHIKKINQYNEELNSDKGDLPPPKEPLRPDISR